MFIRKIKNWVYLLLRKLQLRQSYIDVNSMIDRSALIEKSEIYGNVHISEGCKLHDVLIGGDITIGRFTSLWGPNIQVLSNINPIQIGNFCSIARDVTIHEYFHDYSKLTTFFILKNVFGESVQAEVVSKGAINIGHDVWIGTGVQIMSGVSIGNGAVIAANSTVTKDVPPYSIVAGVPAKIIKYRFPKEDIEYIESLEWWNWSIEKIKNNKHVFESTIIDGKQFYINPE